jgi:hypothetical protein
MSNDIDFWSDVEEQPESFESKGGDDFEVIPAKTRALAEIESVTIESYKDAAEIEYINIQWTLMKPEIYQNRRIFQKIRIMGDDPTQKSYKEDKQEEKIRNAKMMLAAIDKICTGGKLFGLKRMPTEEELQRYLIGKTAEIYLMVYKIGELEGNWVHSVFAPSGNVSAPSKTATKKAAPKPAYGDDDEMDSMIPF